MAHLIDMSNDRANMAYIGKTPWHSLGDSMEEGASIDKWRKGAGMNWNAKKADILFQPQGTMQQFKGQNVLYRDDTQAPLGLVADRYKVVQPAQIIEFFRAITEEHGYTMETAGCLDGGRKLWALAKGTEVVDLGKDKVKQYFLLGTSYDRSLATFAMHTSVRVVCNNTLQAALGTEGRITIRHTAEFDQGKLMVEAGFIDATWQEFAANLENLASKKATDKRAELIFRELLDAPKEETSTRKENQVSNLMNLFKGAGMGAQLKSAKGTQWGVVNAVTQWVDHERGNNDNNRFREGQLGSGAKLKAQAFELALAA